jgi:NTP pyrophosphatase (non-canonical NTP hydrolase)
MDVFFHKKTFVSSHDSSSLETEEVLELIQKIEKDRKEDLVSCS